VNDFLLAVQFFTRIPVGRRVHYSAEGLARGAVYLPLTGFFVGGAAALGMWFGVRWFGLGVGVWLGIAVGFVLTGAIHENAPADRADAPGGMETIRDNPIGINGALALILGLGLKAAAIGQLAVIHLENTGQWIIVAAMGGRLAALALMAWLPFAQGPESAPELSAKRARWSQVVVAGAYTLLLASIARGLGGGFVLLAAVGILTAATGWFFRKQPGGIAGDALGATSHCVEITILVLACAWAR